MNGGSIRALLARRGLGDPAAAREFLKPNLAALHAPAALLDMDRALAVLSNDERAAIVQCYHNDLSHEEAAKVLNCPIGTVKTHILRAKQKMKARLAAWAPA